MNKMTNVSRWIFKNVYARPDGQLEANMEGSNFDLLQRMVIIGYGMFLEINIIG